MNCSNCEFNRKCSNYYICNITHLVNPKGCTYEYSTTKKICYNCKSWIGGGDFGLTCRKYYHKAYTNGFTSACDDFELRD